jgi:MoxR-like ATPase
MRTDFLILSGRKLEETSQKEKVMVSDQTTQPCLQSGDAELLARASSGYQQLKSEIAKVIVGQDEIVRQLLAAIFAQGHTLIIGVPGLAKTLLVKTLAHALGWSFKRIQFTPDMMPADIIGMELLQEDRATGARTMRFLHGPIFANIILADEINRTPPKTQSALLEAMQEYNITSMGKSYALERPFIVVATQNPIEQEGTYPLPEAQLDRFMFSLWVDYPSVEEEEDIVMATTASAERTVEEVFSREQMTAFQELVRRVPASRHVVSYAVAIARATRPVSGTAGNYVRQYVEWGAGPRASQYMVLAGKALAVLDGQTSVCAEHVRTAAGFVLRHRVLPNYNATGEGITAQQIVEKVLSEIKEPDYR